MYPFTYKYIALNEKPPITKQNLCIFFFVIGGVECINILMGYFKLILICDAVINIVIHTYINLFHLTYHY